MACEFVCDGCGKRQKVGRWPGGWFPPESWYSRYETGKAYIACSRECIEKVAKDTQTTDVVLPI